MIISNTVWQTVFIVLCKGGDAVKKARKGE